MERRRLGPTGPDLSVIGLSLDSRYGSFVAPERLVGRLLERARAKGVNLVDTADARDPLASEARLARSLTDVAGWVWVLGRAPRTLSAQLPRPLEAGPTSVEKLAEAFRRTLPQRPSADSPRLLVEWADDGRGDGGGKEVPAALDVLTRAGEIAGWGYRADAGSAPSASEGAAFSSGARSLLEPPTSPSPLPFLARDPFAEGRLDGTGFAGTSLAGPAGGPLPERELRRRYEGVLRLGFLTERHRRTLPEAALRYALAPAGTTSVLVPLPTPERLERLLAFESSDPLEAGEIRRIEGVATAPGGSS